MQYSQCVGEPSASTKMLPISMSIQQISSQPPPRSSWRGIACAVARVGIPTLVISAVIFGSVYYAVGRIEDCIRDRMSGAADTVTNSLEEWIIEQIQNITLLAKERSNLTNKTKLF